MNPEPDTLFIFRVSDKNGPWGDIRLRAANEAGARIKAAEFLRGDDEDVDFETLTLTINNPDPRTLKLPPVTRTNKRRNLIRRLLKRLTTPNRLK